MLFPLARRWKTRCTGREPLLLPVPARLRCQMGPYDVGIIGGGCAGLFLAKELALRNCECVVIEKDPAAAHASTRNQGWLQSGSFYAAVDDDVAARGCHEGYEYITQTYRSAVLQEIDSYCLFRSRQGLRDTLKRCQRAHIPIAEVADNDIRQLQETNPILRRTPLDYMARSEDRPFDTRQLLQSVANEITSLGVDHIEPARMDIIGVTRKSDGWEIDPGNGTRVGCRALVLACGACIPELLESISPRIPMTIKITKTPVLVLQGDPVCTSAIMMPLELGGPNIVPFKAFDGITGVSVCLSRTDHPIEHATDHSLPPKTPEAFAASLEAHLPGITEVIQAPQKSIEAHFYTCQKLKGSSRGPLAEYYEDLRLGIFYPGKFTSSPISARQFADDLRKQFSRATIMSSSSNPLRVARQRYYDRADHKVEVVRGRLKFRPLSET